MCVCIFKPQRLLNCRVIVIEEEGHGGHSILSSIVGPFLDSYTEYNPSSISQAVSTRMARKTFQSEFETYLFGIVFYDLL